MKNRVYRKAPDSSWWAGGLSLSTDLILIDGEPRRRKEQALYKARGREFETKTARLKLFEDQEMPAFMRWVEMTFQRDISAIRTAHLQVMELQELVDEVEAYAAWKRISKRLAYELVQEARKEGLSEALWQGASAADEDAGGDEDAARASFSDLFDDDPGLGAGDDDDWRPGKNARASTTAAETATRFLKDVYRKIVKILHPDTRGSGDDEAFARLWQQVQDAYHWGDLQRLEQILADLSGGKLGVDALKPATISDLIALRKALDAKLRSLKRLLAEAKKHPAWGFGDEPKNEHQRRKLHWDIKSSMAHDLGQIMDQRQALERTIKAWQRPVGSTEKRVQTGRTTRRGRRAETQEW